MLKVQIPQTLQCDTKTKEFFEISALPKIRRYISAKIRKEDFKNYWQKKLSSSGSGLHFGHYKSAVESNITTKLHTMYLDTTIATGSVIDKLTKGFLMMLEKLKEILMWIK